jgi:hypothetical protein
VASSSWNAVLRAKPWLCRQLGNLVSCEQFNRESVVSYLLMPAMSCVHSFSCLWEHTSSIQACCREGLTCRDPKSLNCGQQTGMPPLRQCIKRRVSSMQA